ncbi:MAG: hypothetical protein ACRDGN_07790, partial [bacterium]
MAAADTMLLGRVTYEQFAAHWADKGSDVPFADQMNGTPKLVASRTLDSVEWQNSTLIKGDLAEELVRLKRELGKNIAVSGSGALVRSLLAPVSLPMISAPTLVVHRRGYRLPGLDAARVLAAEIPNARMHVLEGESGPPFSGDME